MRDPRGGPWIDVVVRITSLIDSKLRGLALRSRVLEYLLTGQRYAREERRVDSNRFLAVAQTLLLLKTCGGGQI